MTSPTTGPARPVSASAHAAACPAGPQGTVTPRITAERVSDAYAAANALLARLEPHAPGQLPANLLAELNADICALRAAATAERNKTHSGWFRSRAERQSKERADQSELIANTLELAREALAADGRLLGQRQSQWAQTIASQTQTIARELAAVGGGDAAAQQRLDSALTGLRDTLQQMRAETAADSAQRSRMDGQVTAYEREYVGIFDGTERGIIATARRHSGTLGTEIQEQQALEARIRGASRDAAAEQLRVDPRFANRGMGDVLAREQRWGSVTGPAEQVAAASQRFLQASQEFASARADVARLPGVIAGFEREAAMAQAALAVQQAAFIAEQRGYTQNADIYERQISQATTDRNRELETVANLDRQIAAQTNRTDDPWQSSTPRPPASSSDPWGGGPSLETLRRQRGEAASRAEQAAEKRRTAEANLETATARLRSVGATRDVALGVASAAATRVSQSRAAFAAAQDAVAAGPARIAAAATGFNTSAERYERAVAASGLDLQSLNRIPDTQGLLGDTGRLVSGAQTIASEAAGRASAARSGHAAVVSERERLIETRTAELLEVAR